ncbi:ROGDI-like protein [Mya arenaria]|uniref:ROGDI-like protein n=1 Tax=Mya arenaria TaxID=6604 RepID=A0ABY7E2K4_MYAAR|nr:ROGDI-like protein [Mya arenaria]
MDDTEERRTLECSRRFPFRMGFAYCLRNNKIACLNSPNNTGQIKCVVTLMGDTLCDADISFRHKAGKENHMFKTKISPDIQWPLPQVQEAANHLAKALSIYHKLSGDQTFTSAKQVILMLDETMKLLNMGRTSLAFPKRKSIDDLVQYSSMQNFHPSVPSDVAVSFYVHSAKLILAVYHLHIVNSCREISSRHQVECTVQWLNEAVVLFTLALQQCQQLFDKLKVLESVHTHGEKVS